MWGVYRKNNEVFIGNGYIFVMYMHANDMTYNNPYSAYAICKTIDGEYQLKGLLLYKGKSLKHWDIGTFQDTDGKYYLLIHHGSVYRLSDVYFVTADKITIL